MNESDRFETGQILKAFQSATDLCAKSVVAYFLKNASV
jgi:hypothetical protein